MPAQGGEKHPLASKKHTLQISGALNIVIDARLKRDQTTGVDPQGFALQLALDDGPAGVDENQSVPLQTLQNEAFAAEEAGAEAALEGDVELGAEGSTEEGILLTKHFTAELAPASAITVSPGSSST